MENSKTKFITADLTEKRMAAKGFANEWHHYPAHKQRSVLKHYVATITDEWGVADWYIYEEKTADGFSVFVSTSDAKNIDVSSNVHYSENLLTEQLIQAISNSGLIFVWDTDSEFVEEAINYLYDLLVTIKLNEVKDELISDGYKDPKQIRKSSDNIYK